MADADGAHRVLIKLSGEALLGSLEFGVDPETIGRIAGQIRRIHEHDVQMGIVVGGIVIALFPPTLTMSSLVN